MLRTLVIVNFATLALNAYAFEDFKVACSSKYDAEPSISIEVKQENNFVNAYVTDLLFLATRTLLCTNDQNLVCEYKYDHVNGMFETHVLDTFKTNENGEMFYTSKFVSTFNSIDSLTLYTCQKLN